MQFPSARVEGKVAIVTGTGTGIGQASALALAAAGAKLVLTELPNRTDAAEATASMASEAHGAGDADRAARRDEPRADRRTGQAAVGASAGSTSWSTTPGSTSPRWRSM